MSNETLSGRVKAIMAMAREGRVDEAYSGYRELIGSPLFRAARVEDQRQTVRLMLRGAEATRNRSEAMLSAVRAALEPMTELVSTQAEPADHELLGICHALLGNEQSASAIFKAGLALERGRNPASDLCGQLMKRVSML